MTDYRAGELLSPLCLPPPSCLGASALGDLISVWLLTVSLSAPHWAGRGTLGPVCPLLDNQNIPCTTQHWCKHFQIHILSLSVSLAALRCNCTACEKTGFECETDGACMVSTYFSEGKEEHVRICITRERLVPPGQPFYCLSAEGLLNTHCCYDDYCNSLDLKVPGESPRSTRAPPRKRKKRKKPGLLLDYSHRSHD